MRRAKLYSTRHPLSLSAAVSQALPELGRSPAVARDTQGADIVEIALPAPFGDGQDVVCIPERASTCNGFHPVEGETGDPSVSARAFQSSVNRTRVSLAEGADAAVACKNLVAKEARVGAQPPLEDAIVGAESPSTAGKDFELAPAAKWTSVFAMRQALRADAAARKGTWKNAG